MSKVGSRLIGAAKEARQIAKGEILPAAQFVPSDIKVKDIRFRTKLSQGDFAATFGFTVQQIRDWEQHRSKPLGGVRAYLMLISDQPEMVVKMLGRMVSQQKSTAA